jgi:hypothetical protein
MLTNPAADSGQGCWWGGLFLFCIIWLVLGAISYGHQKSVVGMDFQELRLVLEKWMEQGQPRGAKLELFMEGRGTHLVPSNRVFVIDGMRYETEFAIVKPRSSLLGSGTLFITTNQVFIWQAVSGKTRLQKPLR